MLETGHILQQRFAIEKVLGQGGMGAVYLARHLALGGRAMAIKEMTVSIADPSQRAQAVQQFQKEAQMVAALDHPNLVRVQDYFEEAGHQYLVMDYVDGRNLDDVMLDHDGFLPMSDVLRWADQVFEVLQYLHAQQPPVLFRDLKPSNILLDRKGSIRLIDFGIAKVLDANSQTSTFIHGAGTPGFAPVEQYTGNTDPRSDIYAMGATLYNLLTRVVPPLSIARLSGEATLQPPRAFNLSLPAELEACILKMMGVRREERYTTASAARQALQQSTRAPGPACRQCGVALVPGASFCAECGTRQGDTAPIAPSGESTARVPTPGAATAAKPLPETTVAPPPPRPRPRRRRLRSVWLTMAGVAGVLLIKMGLHSPSPDHAAIPAATETVATWTEVNPTATETETDTDTPDTDATTDMASAVGEEPVPPKSPEERALPRPPEGPVIMAPSTASDNLLLKQQLQVRYTEQIEAMQHHDLRAYLNTLHPECRFSYRNGTVWNKADIALYFGAIFHHLHQATMQVTIEHVRYDKGDEAIVQMKNFSVLKLTDGKGVHHTMVTEGTGTDRWRHTPWGWLQLGFQEDSTQNSNGPAW